MDIYHTLTAHGIDPGGELVEDKLTRATCNCKPTKKGRDGNGWYLYHADDPATLTWGCWNSDCPNATGGKQTAKSETSLTTAERETIKARIEADRKAREEERQKVEAATRAKAARLWKSGHDVSKDHDYIKRKGIRPVGIKQVKDMLLIPMTATGTGEPESLQLIFPDSGKKFLTGTGAVPGPLYFVIPGKHKGGPLYIVEGYATGLSVHEATGASIIVAFSSGKLPAVAVALRERFPDREIIIAGDTGNGSSKATEAALLIGGKVTFPVMPDGASGTDWNDLHQAAGLEEVARQLATATIPARPEAVSPVEAIPPQGPDTETQPQEATVNVSFPLKSGRDLRAMDIKVEWLVDGLIPRGSVVLLYGRGGIGKTTLMMMLANALDRGETIFGMQTTRTQVIVVDFENSLAVLSERAKRTAVDGVLFWDSGQNPPSLDKADWTVYQDLLAQYPGALFVFDTLRSSHSGDENSSEVMTLIMRRMRQLRDAGATVVLLHHTPKGNDRQFKGSGAIFDLCDQTLALYQTAKPGSDQEADDDDDATDKVYRFGTGKKTRYRPHRVFLSFDTEQEVFTLAKDPGDEVLEYLHGIICSISAHTCAKQNEIIKTAMEDGYDFGGKHKIRALLTRGVDRFWTAEKGLHNSVIYRPINQFSSFPAPIGGGKLENRNHLIKTGVCECLPEMPSGKLKNKDLSEVQFFSEAGKQGGEDTTQSDINTGFPGFSDGVCKTGKQGENIPVFTEEDFEGVIP